MSVTIPCCRQSSHRSGVWIWSSCHWIEQTSGIWIGMLIKCYICDEKFSKAYPMLRQGSHSCISHQIVLFFAYINRRKHILHIVWSRRVLCSRRTNPEHIFKKFSKAYPMLVSYSRPVRSGRTITVVVTYPNMEISQTCDLFSSSGKHFIYCNVKYNLTLNKC